MSVKENPNNKKRKWYNSYKFPLIPVLTIKKGCENSTGGFTFEWLFFRIWTLDQFNFELRITCSGHWGLGVIAILPYIRVVACIPCPEKMHTKIINLLGRKPNCA